MKPQSQQNKETAGPEGAGSARGIIVVTGGAGFIGSALVQRLNALGREDILVVDHLGESAKWKNLVPLRYRDYREKDDFLDDLQLGLYDDLEIEAVFHLGACSSTTEADASYLAKNNFGYSQILARFCREREARFIYASSAATYGDGDRGYEDDLERIETLRPLNMYGYSKQMFDLWMRREGLLGTAVGLKFFNVYGPNEYHKGDMKSMVAKAFAQIEETGRVRLFKSHRKDYGDGEQMRDFVYVRDAVDMALHFLSPKAPGGLFNVGAGQARSWKDMMLALFSSMGREPQIDFVDMPEVLRGKYQYYTCADLGRMRRAGYAAAPASLEAGIADYVRYLRAGYRSLGDLP